MLERRLPREAGRVVLGERVVVDLAAGHVRLVEQRLRLRQLVPVDAVRIRLRDAFAGSSEEPEPVASDRTSDSGAAFPRFLERAKPLRIQVAGKQLVADVAADETGSGVRKHGLPRERVATIARDHRQLQAAEVAIGAAAGALDHDFLDVQLAEDEAADGAADDLLVDAVHNRLRLWRAMHAEPRLRPVVTGTLRLYGQIGAGNECGQHREATASGQGVERLALELRLIARAADVHERRLAGDGERFLDRADGHVGVHGGDELAAQLDAFAPDGGEAGQREGDGVRSRTQVDDAVQPLAVRHRRARTRDQRGAAGLDGHTGQHRARGVLDDARDAALRPRGGRQQEHTHGHESCDSLETHLSFLSVESGLIRWYALRNPPYLV